MNQVLASILEALPLIVRAAKTFHSLFVFLSPKLKGMGGERASTTRQRFAGRICCWCRLPMPKDDWPGGERACAKCRPAAHRVTMRYERIFDRWRVSLSESSRSLASLTFDGWEKIEEIARRGRALHDSESKQMFELSIRRGLGVLHLVLDDEQYARLRGRKPPRSVS